MDTFNRISDEVRERIQSIYRGTVFETTDDVFAHVLYLQLGEKYGFDENSMKEWLEEKAQNLKNMRTVWIMHILVRRFCSKSYLKKFG